MAYINENDVQNIREQADIVDVLSDYLTLQPKGKNYVALCPFHNDHSPSLIVSKDKQIFSCFRCQITGNVFSFIMQYENVSFQEAIQAVAKKIGYNLKVTGDATNQVHKKEYEIYNLATKYYINNLNTNDGIPAKKYLESRGINEDIIKEFKIGLATNHPRNLYQLLTKKGYPLEDLDSLGLINKSGSEIYDVFSSRIMIPITNFNGEVVAFTGRIYNGENTAKYLNTKETKIFRKSNILFNYANAKRAIREKGEIIIVEGNMDAIMVSAKGIKNVVALMGVALSNEQIKEINKLKARVVLMLDNDEAGLEATKKVGQKLVENNIDTFVVRLNGAKDPDEYIRSFGIDALNDNIKHAQSYLDFILNALKANKDLQNIQDVVKYIKEVLQQVSSLDALTKDTIISNLSREYQLDKNILMQNLKEKPQEVKEKKEEKVISKPSKYSLASEKILYAMMCDSKYIRIYKEKLGYFKEKIERIIASEIVYYNNNHNGINLADFNTYIYDKDEIRDKVMAIIARNDGDITTDEVNKCIDVVLQELKKDEIESLKKQLKGETDINKKMEILAKITEIKKEV